MADPPSILLRLDPGNLFKMKSATFFIPLLVDLDSPSASWEMSSLIDLLSVSSFCL